MKVLFDIVHPAHMLFFYRPILRLADKGAQIVIASRHKDLTTDLLDHFGLEHTPLSTAGSGMAGLAFEMIVRDFRMLRLARRERPDVMAGFGGVAISHVGALLGIPSLSFYDSEHASLQIALALPFITEWHVPASWTGREAPGRTYRFAATKVQSYLREFTVDPEIARQAGWNPETDNFMVRTVAWKAAHDRGRAGLSTGEVERLLTALAARGTVHIVSESVLPEGLEQYRYRGRPQDIHHLMAKCRLFAGESATMAAESVVLGVPAIFTADFDLGYIDDLVRHNVVRVVPGGVEETLGAIGEMLADTAEVWRTRCADALSGSIDLAAYVADSIEAAALRKNRQSSGDGGT